MLLSAATVVRLESALHLKLLLKSHNKYGGSRIGADFMGLGISGAN